LGEAVVPANVAPEGFCPSTELGYAALQITWGSFPLQNSSKAASLPSIPPF